MSDESPNGDTARIEHGDALDRPDRPVRIDGSGAKSSYCNVCNATSTREEVVLNFGLNQSWDQQDGALRIELHHRVILSPYAAKKLHGVLGALLEEYEKRNGPLD